MLPIPHLDTVYQIQQILTHIKNMIIHVLIVKKLNFTRQKFCYFFFFFFFCLAFHNALNFKFYEQHLTTLQRIHHLIQQFAIA
jgi:hypothetical protein